MNIIHLLRSRCSVGERERESSVLKVEQDLLRVFTKVTNNNNNDEVYAFSLTSIYLESPFRTDKHSTRKKSCSRKVRSMTRISVCKAHLSGESVSCSATSAAFYGTSKFCNELTCRYHPPWIAPPHPHALTTTTSSSSFSPLPPTNCVGVTRAGMDKQVEGQRPSQASS